MPRDEPQTLAEAADERSLNTFVYEAIKERILGNRLRPGNKLTDQELAQMLGVSRTPVREALERLHQEGFVVHIPRRGCFVAEIDAEEASELYELREALELHALRRTAAKGLTAGQVRQLGALTRAYAGLVKDDSTRARLLVDRDFHLALAGAAGNRALSRSLEAVFERLVLKMRTEGFRTSRGKEALGEHMSLFDALRRQNFDEAEKLLVRHIREGRKRLLAHLDEAAADAAS